MKPQTVIWQKISKPILGLSPMDGITDPAFRAVIDTIGHPTVLFTEFVSADGLCRNQHLLRTFQSHKTTTPLIGQLFGKDPKAMEEAAAILIEKTTISGIDINMGCPSPKVAHHGGGAALIQSPKRAKDIILAVKKTIVKSKKSIGLSVKTRIGYDTIVTPQWISFLSELPIDAISLHGRTLKQHYTGRANWDELALAATISKKNNILLFGNGDITSLSEANEKIHRYTPDGVLIGRGCLGNPWIFTSHTPTPVERIDAAIYHCQYFQSLTPTESPLTLRKHLGWYVKSMEHAKEFRSKLITITSVEEALLELGNIRNSLDV